MGLASAEKPVVVESGENRVEKKSWREKGSPSKEDDEPLTAACWSDLKPLPARFLSATPSTDSQKDCC